MKKFVRTTIAAIVVCAMLVSQLAIGGLWATAANEAMPITTNLVTNGDFEYLRDHDDGNGMTASYWHGGSFTTAAAHNNSNYGAHAQNGEAVYQMVAVDQGCSYQLTFWAKIISGSLNVMLVGELDSYLNEECTIGDWALYTLTAHVDQADEAARLQFKGTTSTSEFYLDDVQLVLAGEAVPSILQNGSFETGNGAGWDLDYGEIVEYDDNYVLKATSASRYNTVAEQVIAVEANTDYTLDVKSLYVGTNTGGMARVHIYAGASGTTELASPAYYWNITAGAWDEHQLTFNSGSNTEVRILIQQHAAPNTSTTVNGNIYYDDIVVTKVVASSGNMLQNGSFEEGTLGGMPTGWNAYDTSYQAISTETDATEGSRSAQLALRQARYVLRQNVAVEANTDYTVTYWYRGLGTENARNLYFGVTTTGSNGLAGSSDVMADATAPMQELDRTVTTWTQMTYTFNSGSNTNVTVGFAANSSSAKVAGADGYIIVDDVVMTKAGAAIPENPGSGSDTPAEPEAPAFPADSIRGTYYHSNSAYATLNEKTIDATEGVYYRISFSCRAMTNGIRLNVADAETNTTDFWGEDARGWTDCELIHRASSSKLTLTLTLQNLGNGNLETNVYVTDYVIEALEDEQLEVITSGEDASGITSAMEMTEGKLGLAFLLDAKVTGAETVVDNRGDGNYHYYVPDSATATPTANSNVSGYTPYFTQVVEMGVIMTNDPNVDAESMTMANVAGNRTIKIVGAKNWDIDANGEQNQDLSSYKFAVRVTNIPKANANTPISIRPYYVVKNPTTGTTRTFYDRAYTSSYNQTAPTPVE